MAKKIEDLSTEKLLKRKKLALWLLWLMIFAVFISLAASVYDYYTEKKFNFPTFLSSISACAAAAITLFIGLKKIQKELDRRA
jgi:Na+/melibiose symporter-like transporter